MVCRLQILMIAVAFGPAALLASPEPVDLPKGTTVQSNYDGIAFAMRLPTGWTWRDDVAQASNFYADDPPPRFFVIPLDGRRYASMRFDSDEHGNDDTPKVAAKKNLAKLKGESSRKVREARIIDVGGVPAAWHVTEGTQTLRATCLVRVKDVDLKLAFSFHDSRQSHTPADLTQAHVDFYGIVQSVRWTDWAEAASPDEN
jgi:hypothetical protein